jgi:sec-independent protein translocase protein TatA
MGLDNPLHIVFLVVILLLVFGAKRLPEIGRSLGSGMREFKTSVTGEMHNQSQPTLAAGAPQQQPPAPAQAPVAQTPVPQAQPAAPPQVVQAPVSEPVATPAAPAEQPPAS